MCWSQDLDVAIDGADEAEPFGWREHFQVKYGGVKWLKSYSHILGHYSQKPWNN